MNLKKIMTPFKREVLEYQGSFFGVFLAMGGLLLLLVLVLAFKTGFHPEEIHIQFSGDEFEYNSHSDPNIDEKLSHITNTSLSHLVASVLYVFVLLSGVVTVFYLLGSLFDDRKDRSIMFWKSMPVSELQNVVTKFLTGLYTIPIIAAAIGLITAVLLSIVVGVWLPAVSDFGFFEVFSRLRFLESIAMILVFIFVSGVWLAPFCSWIMLASSVSRKSPILWAVAPPLLVVIAEKMLIGSSTLIRLLNAYLPDLALMESVDNDMSLSTTLALSRVVFSGPEIYIGIAVTAGFLAACVWMRNNRYEF